MKKSQVQEARSKSVSDIKKQLGEIQKSLARTKLEIAMGKETNLRSAMLLRKQIAVLKTIVREKELELSNGNEKEATS